MSSNDFCVCVSIEITMIFLLYSINKVNYNDSLFNIQSDIIRDKLHLVLSMLCAVGFYFLIFEGFFCIFGS